MSYHVLSQQNLKDFVSWNCVSFMSGKAQNNAQWTFPRNLHCFTLKCPYVDFFTCSIFSNLLTVIFNWCAARNFKTCNTWLRSQGTDLFSLRLSNKKMTIANTTIAVWCECIKIISMFLWLAKNVFLGVPQNFRNYECLEMRRVESQGANVSVGIGKCLFATWLISAGIADQICPVLTGLIQEVLSLMCFYQQGVLCRDSSHLILVSHCILIPKTVGLIAWESETHHVQTVHLPE